MFNNKFKKSGSGAALLAAAPTLALQAQGGVEAAAVNSPQALNIVGDSFKGSGNSATKALKSLTWVGGVTCVVLFLVYWGCCVKNNLNLSKKYEGEILKKEEAGPTKEALAECERNLNGLGVKIGEIIENINKKTKENEDAAESIKESEKRISESRQELLVAEKDLDEKEKYVSENKALVEELKRIKSDSEKLEKEITYFYYKSYYDENVKAIREILEQIQKENPDLVSDDLLKKEDKTLLNSLSDELIENIEEFVKNKKDELVNTAFNTLKQHLKEGSWKDTTSLRLYLKGDFESYLTGCLQKKLVDKKVDLTLLVANEKKKFGICNTWSEIRRKVMDAKRQVEYVEKTEVDPKSINSEELLESIKDLKKRVNEKVSEKVLPNNEVEIGGKECKLSEAMKNWVDREEDYHSDEKFNFTSKALFKIYLEARSLLWDKFSLEREKSSVKRNNEFIELKEALINENKNKIKENEVAIENLEKQKKDLEKQMEAKNKVKSSMEKEIASIGELKKHKEKLDQNFWLPYPYSFENNAQ